MNHRFAGQQTDYGSSRWGTPIRRVPAFVGKSCGGIICRKDVPRFARPSVDIAETCVANPYRLFQHCREHRLKIARGAADDFKNLRRCRLLLQRFGKVGCALAQFVEQPRILDGNDCLSGEVLD